MFIFYDNAKILLNRDLLDTTICRVLKPCNCVLGRCKLVHKPLYSRYTQWSGAFYICIQMDGHFSIAFT